MSCLIDSNIIVYFLNRQLPPQARAALESAVLAGAAYASITRIEVLGWSGHTLASKTHARQLLGEMREIALTDAVIESVIALRETHSRRVGERSETHHCNGGFRRYAPHPPYASFD